MYVLGEVIGALLMVWLLLAVLNAVLNSITKTLTRRNALTGCEGKVAGESRESKRFSRDD